MNMKSKHKAEGYTKQKRVKSTKTTRKASKRQNATRKKVNRARKLGK